MSTATDMLAAYLQAEADILLGKETRFNGRTVTMAELNEIREGRMEWERKVAAENRIAAGGGSVRFQTPDFSGGES